ncbi:probable folate-biopterin transporter 4 isoform X1 [Aegilops tauschii subsp. strangulata]|uniref:Folate-biopterin transporter 4 n=3 Tax=Aegilops tauschii subsp. strangulata TaxID=200361 RepID=A0A453EL06_AEGTS|nr:probable folate-biopterin transporter 4 isoform X1 [Aegilops tauschii subsp. strangulata]
MAEAAPASPWWAGRMAAAFGAPFLWLVCLIYFIQGFRSFVWTAVSYQMKDIMKLSPSTSQFLVSAAFFPWSIKPIYGIVSDCIPIKQRKRVPYLIISSGLSLFPWLIIGLSEHLRSSSNLFTLMLIVQNLGSAMADVVIDAMIAEAVRSAGSEFAGDLQSLSWSSMAVGGIFGSLLGGYALSNLPINAIYIIFSALPLFQLVTCVFVKESSKGFDSTIDNAAHDHADDQNIDSAFAGQGSGESFKYVSTRRRKGARKKNKRRTLSKRSEGHEKHNKSVNLYSSLKSAFISLCTAFKQPAILRPMAWFFISNSAVPNISTVMFYYQTEVLHLEASFLGTARVIGWFSLMLGTYIYNRYLKHKKLRNILMFAHLGLAIITVLDILLVSRLHIQYGIADKYMVLWGSALADAINQFKMMPFLILSGQLCPPGIEGTLFALFMSINNLSSTLGSFLGAALTSALNISSVQFDNLALGLTVQLMGTLLPIGFLFLIPRDVTGLTS